MVNNVIPQRKERGKKRKGKERRYSAFGNILLSAEAFAAISVSIAGSISSINIDGISICVAIKI